jgi:hypothetical protein
VTPRVAVAAAGGAASGRVGQIALAQAVSALGVGAASRLGAAGGSVATAVVRGVAAAGQVGTVTMQPAGVPAGVGAIASIGPVALAISAGGTSRRIDAEFGRRPAQRGTRQVEPERKPPSFKQFLENWKPPPFVIVPELVRRPVVPVPRPLPPVETRYPHRLQTIAAALDEAEDLAAIDAAISGLPDAHGVALRRLIEDADDVARINELIAALD